MDVPSLLPQASADPSEDDLAAAEAVVRKYCGWHIAPVIIEDLVLDGSGTSSLFIKSLRLVNVTSAVVDGTVLDTSTLEWSEAGFLRIPGAWPDKLRSVRLTIEHGFDEVPDVASVVRSIAARAGASPAGVLREQAGAVSLTMSQVAPGVAGGVVLMDHERRMLDKYRVGGGS
jgi:hypothetical protein